MVFKSSTSLLRRCLSSTRGSHTGSFYTAQQRKRPIISPVGQLDSIKACFQLRSMMSTSAALKVTQDSDSISDVDWDNLGFKTRETDQMFIMKCDTDGEWHRGQLEPFGLLEVSPSAGVLNYGQGIFEGLKAYRTTDGRSLLFRPEENAKRMIFGAERMCMPAPSVDTFVDAVKQTVLANKRWVPPVGKGSLYVRPLLIGTGPVLGLSKSPEYTFLVYAAPVGDYFKEGPAPIHLKVESMYSRAVHGGTGGVKTICNYAPVLKAQLTAKKEGFTDVLYLDALERKYLEEVSSCNIFIVKDNVIATPEAKGCVLPGITRKCILELAQSLGYKVEERKVDVDELMDADEAFCTGTAVVVSPVGSVTHRGTRVLFSNSGVKRVSSIFYKFLTDLQMGRTADTRGWTTEV
ncbi:hypothetical protein GOP47_0000396 [Adiantum capillus-veneris]|uniref:Branched-chain-amino-acid aminotransferase n=1 Tax=Adiantum capillus-veneris TaxID=13818 RepID=A0A9D4VDG8_ADICA|nr:hypothetical protein GOP47_0000396 [Adiantum capillus-veneris]